MDSKEGYLCLENIENWLDPRGNSKNISFEKYLSAQKYIRLHIEPLKNIILESHVYRCIW